MSRIARLAKFIGLVESSDAVLIKHLQGQHDQSSHGDWADGKTTEGTDYQMSHRPPEPEDGAPAYDLTGGGNIYPKDVYDSDGARIYGHGGDNKAEDKRVHALLASIRNKPDAHVTIYRAVPKGVTKVNAGDWVTISAEYAKLHGEGNVNGEYDILHTTVHASEIYTDGNSLYEWSYYPDIVEKHMQGQHDQSTHGNWAGHGGSKSNYAYPVADAIDAVVAGKKGKLSPLDVHFFMEQMAKREDNPDLTNLEIVGTHFYTGDNMGIPRDKMPQVPSGLKDEFLAEMDKEGVSYKRVDLSPQALHPIQSEISASKSAQIMLSLKTKGIKTDDPSRIIVSSDNYVIDGHHRWAAILTMSLTDSSIKMPVIRVDVPAKELIDVVRAWNDVVGVAPIGLGERNKNSAFAKALRFDIAMLRAKIKSTEVEKHFQGQHDQSTHGRRFNTQVAPEVVHDVLAQVAENGGLSIKLTDGSLPPDGYMVSRDSEKFGTVVMASDFFNEKKGAKILGAFLIKNKAELGSGRAYLGVWHETSKTVNGVTVEIPKDQQRVHLDVTDKIVNKKQAVSLGRRRNQISIWDVVNFDEIQTGGTGGTVEKGSYKHSLIPETVESDDGRGNYGLGGKDLREVTKASIIVQVPVGSFFTKHLQGQHDQSSHGSWSGGAGQDITKEISQHLKNVFKEGDKEYKIFGYNISLELQKQITAMEKWDEAHGVGTMYQDYILRMVAERQGFTGKPKTVKADEFAELRKQGYEVVFRGITDSYDDDGKLIATAEQIYEQFKTGNYYAGIGDFGDGTYVTNNPALATAYAKNDYDNGDGKGKGLVVAMLIPPDYVTLPKTKLSALTKTARKNTLLEIKDKTKVWAGSTDVGVLATAQGVQFYTTKTPEGAGASTKCFNILDRSGLIVLDTPYWSSNSEVSKNDAGNLNKIVMESRKRAKESKSITGDKAIKLFDEIWQPLWDNLANVSKHLEGQHDQSSHGNWAKNNGVIHKPNNLSGVAIPWKTSKDWSDVVPTGAPDDKQIEFGAGLTLDSAPLASVGQGKIFTDSQEISNYVDEVFAKYGYGDRVWKLYPDEANQYLVDGIEAGVTRGDAPEGHVLSGGNIPVLIYKPSGVSQFVLLHEISHILEGNWTEGNVNHGGHNLPFLETWKYLLRNEGLDQQANVLDLFTYKTNGNGVFS